MTEPTRDELKEVDQVLIDAGCLGWEGRPVTTLVRVKQCIQSQPSLETLRERFERIEAEYVMLAAQMGDSELELEAAFDAAEPIPFKPSAGSETVDAKLLTACERAFTFYSIVPKPFKELVELVAAARAQSADDAMPVDGEWLALIGFTRDKASHLSFRVREFATLTYLSSIPVLQVSQMGNFVNFHIDTRGDVRRLLAALGVNK